jgi:hypothetical protein
MASDAFLSWANRTVLRAGREEPYLSIQDIVVFVRDLDVSKRFYLQQLGFELVTEQRSLPTGERWIEVALPMVVRISRWLNLSPTSRNTN